MSGNLVNPQGYKRSYLN